VLTSGVRAPVGDGIVSCECHECRELARLIGFTKTENPKRADVIALVTGRLMHHSWGIPFTREQTAEHVVDGLIEAGVIAVHAHKESDR
jgi:hypothetical protein